MTGLLCPDCGQTYLRNAGHCRGGRYEGCCKSFRANRDFDLHRTGKFEDSSRRCRTTEEMQEKGWEFKDGLWASPQTVARRGRPGAASFLGASERSGLDSGTTSARKSEVAA